MLRVLTFLLAIIFIVYKLWQLVLYCKNRWATPEQPSLQPQPDKDDKIFQLVPCAYCAVQLPAAEAIQYKSRGDAQISYYCCRQHLELALKN